MSQIYRQDINTSNSIKLCFFITQSQWNRGRKRRRRSGKLICLRRAFSLTATFDDSVWGAGDAKPGVVDHISQSESFFGVHFQAARDQALHLLAQLQLWEPSEVGSADLGVGFKGDVATDHVIEEDAKGPDC